jgi:pilus biogenesis lipoprotein CpaD
MTDPKRPFRALKTLFAVSLMIGASGCENLNQLMPDLAAPKTPQEKRLQLQAIDHAHAVRFPAGRADLLAEEAAGLVRFLTRRARAARYTVYLVPDTAPTPEITDARAETVAAYLEGYGFHTRTLAPLPDRKDEVRVVVRSYTVTLPGCPDWTSQPGKTTDNVVHSNWGCANATNLGLMVADPGDLGRGRDAGGADAELLGKRIQDYRKGETKPLDPEDIGTIESQQKTGGGGQ